MSDTSVSARVAPSQTKLTATNIRDLIDFDAKGFITTEDILNGVWAAGIEPTVEEMNVLLDPLRNDMDENTAAGEMKLLLTKYGVEVRSEERTTTGAKMAPYVTAQFKPVV